MSANQKLFIQDLQKSIQTLSAKHGCTAIPFVKEGDLGLEMRIVFRPKRTDANLFDENVLNGISYINRQMRDNNIDRSHFVSAEALAKFSFEKNNKVYYFMDFVKRNKIMPLLMISDTGELFNTDWTFFLDTKTLRG